MPHMAVPSLTAYLRQRGVQVTQWDLNIEVFDEILSRRYLSGLVRRLQREGRSRSDTANQPPAQQKLLRWANTEGRALASKVDDAKAIVRSNRFYEAAAGLEAWVTLNQALTLASVPHFPSRIHLTGYDSAYPVDASRAILAAVSDRQLNLFHDLLRRIALPRIARERPDIVGISVTSARQVISAFTLAYLIKEAGIKTHITLGGKMITCWRDQLPKARPLFRLCDSAVTYAGEEALWQLVEAVEGHKDLSSVPNLIYRDHSRIVRNEVQPALPVGELPLPDYDGFPLRRYLAPEPLLPISASRGCYWHRCAFCNVGHGESQSYQEKQAAKVHAEMLALAQAYGVRHFFFSDEAVSPRILKLLSRRMVAQGTDLDWACAARFERSLDAPTLQTMARAGCKMLMYGLESGSQRILDRMDKGTSLDIARRILKDGAEAGIWNHIFFFFGFPGETIQDAQETVDFFYGNRAHIHSACSGTFMLERYSKVMGSPERYDVSRVIQPHDRDLSYYYDYSVSSGINATDAEQVEAHFIDSLPGKKLAHLYFHDIYRFLYATQFDEKTPFPTML